MFHIEAADLNETHTSTFTNCPECVASTFTSNTCMLIQRNLYLILNTFQYRTVTKFISSLHKVIWEVPFDVALFHLVSFVIV